MRNNGWPRLKARSNRKPLHVLRGTSLPCRPVIDGRGGGGMTVARGRCVCFNGSYRLSTFVSRISSQNSLQGHCWNKPRCLLGEMVLREGPSRADAHGAYLRAALVLDQLRDIDAPTLVYNRLWTRPTSCASIHSFSRTRNQMVMAQDANHLTIRERRDQDCRACGRFS